MRDSIHDGADADLPKTIGLFHPGSAPRQATAPLIPGRRVSSLPPDVVDLLRDGLKEKKPCGVHAIVEAVQKAMREKGVIVHLGKLQNQIREMAKYSQKKGRWELKDDVGEQEDNDGVNNDAHGGAANNDVHDDDVINKDVPRRGIMSIEQDIDIIVSDESENNKVLLAKVTEVPLVAKLFALHLFCPIRAVQVGL